MAQTPLKQDAGGNPMTTRVVENYQSLRGPEKAAMLILAVGETNAMKIFEYLQDEEIVELSGHMTNLGKINAEVIEQLLAEFVDLLTSTGSVVGTMDSTEKLLSKVLDPERAGQIMDDIRGPAGRTMWDKLSNVNEILLANFLKNEYPQTVAVVLSRIRADHAAKVLENLPENFALEVIMRMLRMEPVKKEILESVERTLRTEFMTNLARSARSDAHEAMAEIFNNLSSGVENRFMAVLEERNRESAERIKSLMFTFEDLMKLDNGSMQILIRNIDTNLLAIALRGADDDLRDLFYDNMSQRASRILREDMDTMGPVRLRDVDDAQSKIVQMAKDMAAKGEIIIAEGGGEDEVLI